MRTPIAIISCDDAVEPAIVVESVWVAGAGWSKEAVHARRRVEPDGETAHVGPPKCAGTL